MKSLLRSKTFWVAILQGIAGVLVVVQTEMPEVGMVVMGKSIIDIMLRLITTKPIE